MQEISRRNLIKSAAGLAAMAPLARLPGTDLVGVEQPEYDSETGDFLAFSMYDGHLFALVRAEGGAGELRQLARGSSETFYLPGRNLGVVPIGTGRVAMSRSAASTLLAVAETRTIRTFAVSYELSPEDEALLFPGVPRAPMPTSGSAGVAVTTLDVVLHRIDDDQVREIGRIASDEHFSEPLAFVGEAPDVTFLFTTSGEYRLEANMVSTVDLVTVHRYRAIGSPRQAIVDLDGSLSHLEVVEVPGEGIVVSALKREGSHVVYRITTTADAARVDATRFKALSHHDRISVSGVAGVWAAEVAPGVVVLEHL